MGLIITTFRERTKSAVAVILLTSLPLLTGCGASTKTPVAPKNEKEAAPSAQKCETGSLKNGVVTTGGAVHQKTSVCVFLNVVPDVDVAKVSGSKGKPARLYPVQGSFPVPAPFGIFKAERPPLCSRAVLVNDKANNVPFMGHAGWTKFSTAASEEIFRTGAPAKKQSGCVIVKGTRKVFEGCRTSAKSPVEWRVAESKEKLGKPVDPKRVNAAINTVLKKGLPATALKQKMLLVETCDRFLPSSGEACFALFFPESKVFYPVDVKLQNESAACAPAGGPRKSIPAVFAAVVVNSTVIDAIARPMQMNVSATPSK